MVTTHWPKTMGCGCSRNGTGSRPTSGRRVNPSESPGSTPERAYGLKPNGCLTNGLSNASATTIGGRPVLLVHRGVDTGSLRTNGRYSPLWLRRGQAIRTTSTGVQCDIEEDRDDTRKQTPSPDKHAKFLDDGFQFARNGSSSWASSRCSSMNRISRRSLAATTRLSFSTNNLPSIATEWSNLDSNARLTNVRLSTSGFLPPINANDVLSLVNFPNERGSNELLAGLVKMDASSQTDQDLGGAAVPPELVPRPPASRKAQLLKNRDFAELDKIAKEVPVSFTTGVRCLAGFLSLSAKTDLELVRSFYVWIAHHIRYDIKYADVETNPEDTLELRAGVSKDYCQLFSEMCRLSDVRVEVIRGFAKGFSHNAGHSFCHGQDDTHCWNAVFLGGSWRLIDCTWGTGIVNSLGRFQERFSDHFFLTDPDVFSWTHFPYSKSEKENYFRWQLVETPLTLEEFNALPKVFPHFFEYRIKIRTPVTSSPIVFAYSTELLVSSPQVLRYKYKLYSAGEVESHDLNQYVFCQLTQQRLCGSFSVNPPDDGDYIFKIYAKPEAELQPESILNCVLVFVLRCTKTWKNVPRYPMNDLPWGVTNYLVEFGLKILNVSNPVIVVVTGRKCVLVETTRDMLMTHQLTDAHGHDIPPKNTVSRTEDKDKHLVRFLIQPPDVGFYKFSLYACPKPTEQGQWRLPCIATYLVDCKQTLFAAGELREQIFVKKTKKTN